MKKVMLGWAVSTRKVGAREVTAAFDAETRLTTYLISAASNISNRTCLMLYGTVII